MLLQKQLFSFLKKVQKRWLWVQLLRAIAFFLSIWILFGFVLYALQPILKSHPTLFWYVGSGLLLFLLATVLIWFVRQARDKTMSKRIEDWFPDSRGFRTALELSEEIQKPEKDLNFSVQLASKSISNMVQKSYQWNVVHSVPQPFLHPILWGFVFFSLCFFGALFFRFSESQQFIQSLFFKAPTSLKVSVFQQKKEMIVRDLQIDYIYPAYTKKKPENIPNSDGNLSGIYGSKVRFKGVLLFPSERIELFFSNSETLLATLEKDRVTFSGELTLLKNTSFQFKAVDLKKNIHSGVVRTIEVQQDQFPTIQITSEFQKKPYQNKDSIPIHYDFSDDFGVSKIGLRYFLLNRKTKKKTVVLQSFESHPKKGMAKIKLDLARYPFAPGDEVEMQLIIWDNDTLKGPKKSVSSKFTIRIDSPTEEHDRLLAEQEKVFQLMVLFLGDLLEKSDLTKSSNPFARKRLAHFRNRSKQILNSFETLIPSMQKNEWVKPFVLITLHNLKARFEQRSATRNEEWILQGYLHSKTLIPVHRISADFAKEVPFQEDDVFAFSLLLNRQQLDQIKELSKELTKAQNQLQELLEQYKKDKSPALKEQILEHMRRMKHLIQKIRKRMSQLSRQIQDEYLNLSVFKRKGSLAALKKMESAVQKDQMQKAADELSKLTKSIEQMTSEMERFSKEAGSGKSSRLAQEIKQMIENIQQIEEKQTRLSQKTNFVQKNVQQRMMKSLQDAFQKLRTKQLKELETMEKLLKESKIILEPYLRNFRYFVYFDILFKRIDEMKKLYAISDYFGVLKNVKEVIRYGHSLQSSVHFQIRTFRLFRQMAPPPSLKTGSQKIKEVLLKALQLRKELEKFFPSSSSYLEPKEKQLLQQYKKQQKELRSQTQDIEKKMKQITQKMPMFKPEMSQKLSESIQNMKNAEGTLKKGEPQPSFQEQMKAVSHLKSFRQSLQKSMQSQMQRSKKNQNGQKNGMMSKEEPREKIKIPPDSNQKDLQVLKKEILKAMKEKLPSKYKKKVHQYYEELVK